MVALGAVIATAAAFLAWFFRAYVNIERLGARELRATKGRSIGVWFRPLLNLIRPKQLMDDVWRASDPALPPGEVHDWHKAAVPALPHGWWALFLLSGFISNIAGRMLTGADTLAERTSAGQIAMIGDGAIIAAAILAVVVVLSVTSRQERLPAADGRTVGPAGTDVVDRRRRRAPVRAVADHAAGAATPR